jgi:hypothetical protein
MRFPVRLAMRVEGDWWVAYIATSNSMDGAHRLGSILLSIVQDKDRKQAFMDLMKSAMADAIVDAFGQQPTWTEEPAPEAERSGRA